MVDYEDALGAPHVGNLCGKEADRARVIDGDAGALPDVGVGYRLIRNGQDVREER